MTVNEEKIDITISSDLDYENLIAEINIDGKFIGLVTNEPGKDICFEIPEGQLGFTTVNLERLQMALERAKDKLG